MTDLLPTGFSVALLAGAAMFLAMLSVLRAMAPAGGGVAARARSHAKRREELRTAWIEERSAPKRDKPINLARGVVEGLKLQGGKDAKDASYLLRQAGWRNPDATMVYLAFRLASPPLVALAAYFATPLLIAEPGTTTNLVAGMIGMGVGVLLPKILLKNFIQRRQHKIQKGLPDALDLLVICAEAGLSLDAAIKRVGTEIGGNSPELADELGLTSVELGFLPDRREALRNLSDRIGTQQIESLVNMLAQTEKYGTPLAQALRILSQEFRNARMMKAEQKAARLPAVLTVPMITFILPPLFVVLIGPAVVQVLNTSFS